METVEFYMAPEKANVWYHIKIDLEKGVMDIKEVFIWEKKKRF